MQLNMFKAVMKNHLLSISCNENALNLMNILYKNRFQIFKIIYFFLAFFNNFFAIIDWKSQQQLSAEYSFQEGGLILCPKLLENPDNVKPYLNGKEEDWGPTPVMMGETLKFISVERTQENVLSNPVSKDMEISCRV